MYIRFKWEADAGKANTDLNSRYYAGKPLYAELSPVTDFGEGFYIDLACCRQHDLGECNRGGFCNFMHLKDVSEHVKKDLFQAQAASLKMLKKDRGPSPPRRGFGGDVYRDDRRR